MKGKLIDKKTLQTFAESRNLDELIIRMRNSKYSDSVSKISKPYDSEKIELTLRGRQAELHDLLNKSVGNSELLSTYYLKFLIKNLKTILKLKALGKPYEEIEPHINLRSEELIGRRDLAIKAMLAKDLDEATKLLEILNFEDEIQKALSAYKETKILPIFDVYLDKMFFQHLSHVIKNSADINIISLFGLDLDFYNITSILRGKFWGLDNEQIESFMVPHTSSTPDDVMLRMIPADSIKLALNELASTKYKNLIPLEEDGIKAIEDFERSFELLIFRKISEDFSKIFSFSTVVAMSRLLDYETRNLSSIAYGVEQGIPPEIVMSKLILVD